MRCQAKRKERSAGTTASNPLRFVVVVDAELELPKIRLVEGHSGVVLERQMKASPPLRIVLTDQVARHVVEIPVGVQPERYREIARSQSWRRARRDFEIRIATVEVRADDIQLDSVIDGVVAVAGVVS